MKRLILAAITAIGLGTATAQPEPVRFGYVLWDAEIAITHLVAAVVVDELGYEVDLISVDAGPMYIGLAQGDLDVSIAIALPITHAAYWDMYGDQLVDLGPYRQGDNLGIVVPDYVTIDSIAEMNDYADEFDGRIIGIDPGSGIMGLTEEVVDVYGLDNFELIDGSDSAMVAGLDRAVTRGDWIAITGWDPHWKWAVYDLKYLEDPEGVYGQQQTANMVLNPEFAENAPEDLLAFLDNFTFTPQQSAELMLGIIEDGTDPWDAAREWIASNRDLVDGWLE